MWLVVFWMSMTIIQGEDVEWIKDEETGMEYADLNQHTPSKEASREACASVEARLPKPKHAQVNVLLQRLGTNNFYIGMNDEDDEGVWVWDVDGSPVTWFDWNRHEPDGGINENCAVVIPFIFGDIGWADKSCVYNNSRDERFSTVVCERRESGPPWHIIVPVSLVGFTLLFLICYFGHKMYVEMYTENIAIDTKIYNYKANSKASRLTENTDNFRFLESLPVSDTLSDVVSQEEKKDLATSYEITEITKSERKMHPFRKIALALRLGTKYMQQAKYLQEIENKNLPEKIESPKQNEKEKNKESSKRSTSTSSYFWSTKTGTTESFKSSLV